MCVKKLILSTLLLFSFCHLSSAETLKEYADKCAAEIGVAVPAFNCQTFEIAQKEGSAHGSGPCDFPNRLNRACDPGSRIKVLHNDANVAIVASCRKVGADIDTNNSIYNDIAVIQHNKKNGATCFYQALNGDDGSVVPSPSSPPVPGAPFEWLTPSGTAGINCVACHDNGAFMRSPYMASALNFPNQNIGGSTVTSNLDGDPYWFVGSDFQSRQWKTYSVYVKDNACLSCHRLSVSTTNGSLNAGNTAIQNFGNSNSIESATPFLRSTAMDFSLIATAGAEKSKSPHSSLSPIWMPVFNTTFDATYANAAKEISDCAHQFNANNLPNSDSCRITPHPKPVANIVHPVTATVENAGDRTNPGKIWVHIDPPVGALPDIGQYTVKIAGVTANIVSGLPVGNQFWMVVQPVANNVAIPAAGLYDLEVTVAVPNFSSQTDKEIKAVYFGDPGVPVDVAIVGDVSGSMSGAKLAAAQNAARLYVDHASTGDQIAVVSFANSASVDMPLTPVDSNSLSSARAEIGNWSASGQTALGSGLLEAAAQLDAGNPDHLKLMAVLTDGNENVSPKWADGPSGSVQTKILDQKSIIDMVTLGNDADVALAKDIATQTKGHYFRVDPSSNVALASTQSTEKNLALFAQFTAGSKGFSLLSNTATGSTFTPGFVATSQTTNTMTLPNILADVYKSMAENARKEHRIGDWNGQFNAVGEADTYEITLESGLPEVLFAVNWNSPNEKINLLFNKLSCGRYQGQQIVDSTHMQCRIIKPTPGKWTISVHKTSGTQAVNYKLMVSAYSQTVLMPQMPSKEFLSGDSFSLLAYVGNHKPPKQAVVFVNILLPNGTQMTRQLFDDGLHDEGKKEDGYFGNLFTFPISGTYAFDFTATGINSDGVAFKRKVRRSLLVNPRQKLPYGLMSKETLSIGDKGVVKGPSEIYAGRSLDMGVSAFTQANALIPGYVIMQANSTLDGNLRYSSGLQMAAGAKVTGTISLITPESLPYFDSFVIPYGGRDIYIDPGKTGTWNTGDYRDAYVGSGSTLTLYGGIYRFRSLTVDSSAVIKTTGGKTGPTLIFVDDKISISDKIRIEGQCISCLVIYSNSREGVSLGSSVQFKGSVVAPNGIVSVASTKNTFINVAARSIQVSANANISLKE
ncbi:MAG: VWA domain-containing protein [Cellvibrio sp.]